MHWLYIFTESKESEATSCT